jgi:hypothetical protein
MAMAIVPKDYMPIPPEHRVQFEETGEARVRQFCSGGIYTIEDYGIPDPSFDISARKWLAEKDEAKQKADEARRVKDDAFQAQQTWLGRIAAYGAIGAVIVGVIGICVAILLWRFPRH